MTLSIRGQKTRKGEITREDVLKSAIRVEKENVTSSFCKEHVELVT